MPRSVCHPETGPLLGDAKQIGVQFLLPPASKDSTETRGVSSEMQRQASMA